MCTIRRALLGLAQEEFARLSLIDEPPDKVIVIGDFGGPGRHGEHFFLLVPTAEGGQVAGTSKCRLGSTPTKLACCGAFLHVLPRIVL